MAAHFAYKINVHGCYCAVLTSSMQSKILPTMWLFSGHFIQLFLSVNALELIFFFFWPQKMVLKRVKDLEPRILFGTMVICTVLSAIGADSAKIWFLEAAPVLLALPLFVFRYYKYHDFRVTPLLYRLLFFGGLLLLMGAHYSYAKV